MRTLVMLVAALSASTVSGLLVAIPLANWTGVGMEFLLVYFGLGIGVAVGLIVFLLARRRPLPERAIDRTFAALLAVVAGIAAFLAVDALTDGLDRVLTLRALRHALVLGATVGAAVTAQWLVFRFFARFWPDGPPASRSRRAHA